MFVTLEESTLNWLNSKKHAIGLLNPLSLSSLETKTTCLVLLDLLNGFTREGPLASVRIEILIPVAEKLTKNALKSGIPVIAFCDAHLGIASEFDNYPPHCQIGSSESALVKELEKYTDILRIDKNSTQGWHEPIFQQWRSDHPEIDTWILAGDCTDICVLQFALALKTNDQRQNRNLRVIIPENAVNTFDTSEHPGNLHHIIGLSLMMDAGIEIYSEIE